MDRPQHIISAVAVDDHLLLVSFSQIYEILLPNPTVYPVKSILQGQEKLLFAKVYNKRVSLLK